MKRPLLVVVGLILLSIGVGLAVANRDAIGGAASTAARHTLAVPLAVDREGPRDSFWTITASGGMAFARDDSWDLGLAGVSPTALRRSEWPDQDALLTATSDLTAHWDDWFGEDGVTNGTLSFVADPGGVPRSVVVEVGTPTLEGDALSLQATLVEPTVLSLPVGGAPDRSLPNSFTAVTLTLDADAAFSRAIGPVRVTAWPAPDNSVDVEVALADVVAQRAHLTPVRPELSFESRGTAGLVAGTIVARYADGRADVSLDASPLTWALAGEPATDFQGPLGSW